MAKTDFRAAAARRLSEEQELPPAIIGLLSPEGARRGAAVRSIAVDRIEPNPDQPRMTFDEAALEELAASVREHGVLQPVLVRPAGAGRYQLVAGERRWRASRIAGLPEVPAMIEEIDDETALEIAIIENLQREDLSPLDEALMYERMTQERGYSIRKLAQKLGKDKGYIENRLRLADAPSEVKQLVSLRKDTLSHAYELLKVTDSKKRTRLAEQVARGELSLSKLRERIEGRPRRAATDNGAQHGDEDPQPGEGPKASESRGDDAVSDAESPSPLTEDSLVAAKGRLGEALDELAFVFRSQAVLDDIAEIDRVNLAKYLTIAKLRLENVIAVVRAPDADRRR